MRCDAGQTRGFSNTSTRPSLLKIKLRPSTSASNSNFLPSSVMPRLYLPPVFFQLPRTVPLLPLIEGSFRTAL